LQELVQDSHELVVDHLHTFQAWVLESLDLLLDENLKGSGTDEQRRLRALVTEKSQQNVREKNSIKPTEEL
jgi:hypothetical protein